jgi:hypothetical protein
VVVSGTKAAYTPAISDSSGHNFTMSQQQGEYLQIGPMVFVGGRLTWTAKGSAVSTDVIRISLPVTTAGVLSEFVGSLADAGGFTFTQQISFRAESGVSYGTMINNVTGSASTSVLVSQAPASGVLTFSVWYFV